MPKKVEKMEVFNSDNELSYDTKTLITVITLVTVYPVGFVLMLVWMKWNKWIKFLVGFPVFFVILIPILLTIVAGVMLIKLGNSFSDPELIREIKQRVSTYPIERVMLTGTVLSPTIREIKR